MIPNEHHEADVKYVLEQSHIVLRLLAIWPLTDRQPNTIERITNISLMIIYYFLLHCEMVLGMFYYLLVDDEARVKAKIMAPFLYSIMSIGKYSTLIAHERGVRSCLRHIKEDWTMMIVDDAREVMMVKVITGRRIFTVCCIFMYGAGITYTTIVPISRGSVITDQNVTIRPLPFPGHLIYFDVQNSPVYEIVYLLQFLCGLVMYTITVTICGLAALFVMHACAQVEILMRLMENFVDNCKVEQKNINAKLADIIEHEIRIRNFLRLVEDTMCYSNLVEILGCTVIICLVGYCAIAELEEQNVMAMCSLIISIISNTLNIFILCFIGEYITTQVEKMSLTFGTINWYRLPTNTVRNMVLVTVALNIPPQFTAGKFIDLSFKTFGDVIKSALIYLNMLRQLT